MQIRYSTSYHTGKWVVWLKFSVSGDIIENWDLAYLSAYNLLTNRRSDTLFIRVDKVIFRDSFFEIPTHSFVTELIM